MKITLKLILWVILLVILSFPINAQLGHLDGLSENGNVSTTTSGIRYIPKLWQSAVHGGMSIWFFLSSIVGLELLYQFCLKPGHIFGFAGKYFNNLHYKIKLAEDMEFERDEKRLKRIKYFMYPLGMCPYCNIIWLLLLFLFTFTPLLVVWVYALYAGLVFLSLSVVKRLIDILDTLIQKKNE